MAVFASALALISPAVGDDVHPSLLTTLEVFEGRYLSVRVENTGEAVLTLDVRDTVLDPVQAADVLSIARPRKGWSPLEPVSYIGREAKRLPPTAADRLIIAPGASVSARLDLAGRYRIPIEGDYLIELRSHWHLHGPSSVRTGTPSGANASPPGTIARLLPLDAGPAPRLRPARFTGCTAAQRDGLSRAVERAEAMAIDAAAGLATLRESHDSPRYAHWFGAWQGWRHAVVTRRFGTIADALRKQELAFDCGCNDAGVFAYVYPLRPYQIFLCPVFWNARNDGTDSRAGTLVHELSHFESVAGTDDHVYTQARAAALARSNPNLATYNADNYEYFAENTPALELVDVVDPGVSDGTPAPLPASDTGPLAEAGLLAPGRRVEGMLGPGERHVYRVEGPAVVQLESLHGDADLAIYPTASLSLTACESALQPPMADSCAIEVGMAWISVLGVGDTRYALMSLDTGASSATAQSVSATLLPGESSGATLSAGQSLYFGLSDVAELTLESIDGDADLYVFDGSVALADRLLCIANQDAAALDVCSALPGGSGLAVVFSYSDSRFLLSAGSLQAASDQDRPAEDDTIGASPEPLVESVPVASGSGSGGAGFGLLGLLAGGRLLRRLTGVVLATVSVNACAQGAVPIGGHRSVPDGAVDASDRAPAAISISITLQLLDPATGRIRVQARHEGHGTPVRLLLWDGPFEATLSASSVFLVARDGERLDYRGRLVKRGARVAEAWRTLVPGGTLVNELELGNAYDLTMAGRYEVTLLPASLTLDTAAQTPIRLVLPERPVAFVR